MTAYQTPFDTAYDPDPDTAFGGSPPPVDPPTTGFADPDDEPERPDDDPEPETLPVAARTRKPRSDRSAIRRAVHRALAISDAPAEVCELLAVSLGLAPGASIADLALAASDSPKHGVSAITTVLDLAASSPLEAGVLAVSLASDRHRIVPVWQLVRHLDDSLPASVPAGHTKAGMNLATAAQNLDQSARELLADTLVLLA